MGPIWGRIDHKEYCVEREVKCIFITGGSRGIGRELVKTFLRAGHKVAFSYLENDAAARELAESFRENNLMVRGFKLDVGNMNSVKHHLTEIKTFLENRIDVLINNAGVKRDKTLIMMKEEDWDQVMETNLKGVFVMSRLFIVDMLKQKFGKIINITSVSGIKNIEGQTNYSASKAGIIGFTKSLAKEVASYGITVNAVAPGFIRTDMISNMKEKRLSSIENMIPLKRLGAPEEISKVVAFLASNNADYITGQVIAVDGGLTI